MVALLESMLQTGMVQSVTDRVSRKKFSVNLAFVREFANPDDLEPRVRRILETAKITERQDCALREFLRSLERERSGTPERDNW